MRRGGADEREAAPGGVALLQQIRGIADPARSRAFELVPESDVPHARLRERDAHVPGPAFGRAPAQGLQRAQRREVARRVVVLGGGGEPRRFASPLDGGDARHGLRELLPARALAPGAAVPVTILRDVDDARPEPRELLGPEAAPLERPLPEALREDVGVLHELAQRLGLPGIAQIQMDLALAVAGVHLEEIDRRKSRRGDVERVGAVLRQRPRTRGSGEHAREIEHADSGERPRSERQRLGRGVADPEDLHGGPRGEPAALRAGRPLLDGAHRSAAHAPCGERVLEREGIALRSRRHDGVAVGIGRQSQLLQDARPVVEARVQVDEASVAARMDGRDRIRREGAQRRVAVDAEQRVADQRRGGVAHVDAQRLGSAAAELPEPIGCLAHQAERNRGSLREMKRRLEDRIVARDLEVGRFIEAETGELCGASDRTPIHLARMPQPAIRGSRP